MSIPAPTDDWRALPPATRHTRIALLGAAILLLRTKPLFPRPPAETGPLVVDGLRLINGTQLYCESIGTGVPLVVIHGGPGLDHSYLLPQMEQLADSYELIFFDQRGCGKSTIRLDSTDMTLDALVEDIDKVRDAYNLNTMNLMGHSWGGLLAMFYAVKHGDRLNSLILVNSSPPTSALRDSTFKIHGQRTSPEDSAAQAAIIQTVEFKRREPATMEKYFRLLFKGSFYNPLRAEELTLSFGPDYGGKEQAPRLPRERPAAPDVRPDGQARVDHLPRAHHRERRRPGPAGIQRADPQPHQGLEIRRDEELRTLPVHRGARTVLPGGENVSRADPLEASALAAASAPLPTLVPIRLHLRTDEKRRRVKRRQQTPPRTVSGAITETRGGCQEIAIREGCPACGGTQRARFAGCFGRLIASLRSQ